MFSIKTTILNVLSVIFLSLSIASLTNAVPASGVNPAGRAPPPSTFTWTSIPPPTSSITTPSSADTVYAPPSGMLNITSKCKDVVWYLYLDDIDQSDTWQVVPTEGVVQYFSQFPGSGYLGVLYKFTKNPPAHTSADGIFTELDVMVIESLGQVAYGLSDQHTNGTSPLMRDGYMASPMPATTVEYPYCNKLQCAANENPCAASYQPGENITYPEGRTYGDKTNICPDSITLNFQLC